MNEMWDACDATHPESGGLTWVKKAFINSLRKIYARKYHSGNEALDEERLNYLYKLADTYWSPKHLIIKSVSGSTIVLIV